MKFESGEAKKILIVVILLVFLLLAVIVTRAQKQLSLKKASEPTAKISKEAAAPSPTLYETKGVYSLKTENATVPSGGDFTVSAHFLAVGSSLFGSDLILKFDPSYLQAVKVSKTGTYFSDYPISKVDNEKGVVRLSGYSMKDTPVMEKEELMGDVQFRAVKAGRTEISFDFTRGTTNRTTLVEAKTSRNVLGSAGSLTLTIE